MQQGKPPPQKLPKTIQRQMLGPGQEKNKESPAETLAMTQSRTVTAHSMHRGTKFVCFLGYMGPSHAQSYQQTETFLWLPQSRFCSCKTTKAPKTSQTTSRIRAPHFPFSSFSSTWISGESCADNQTCKPSRSSNRTSLHTGEVCGQATV